MTNHEGTTAPLLRITTADMAATTPTGTIAMTETAVAPIVMMIAAGATAPGMMTVGEEVIMAPGEMIAEDTTIGTMTVIALATNATTTMMMIVMTVEADTALPVTVTEVMWITGIGIGMKDQVVLARRKVKANMGGINL